MADRKLVVKIIGDASSLERAFGRAEHSTKSFGRSLGNAFAGLARGAAFAAGAAGVGGLALVLHEGTKELAEHQRVAAQTAAALKSTGSAAQITAKQVDALALSLSNLSGVDDEVIQQGENILLSFTKIRNAAGKGNDIFNQATKAALDFAVRTGRDVPAAAVLLGRALQDPASKLAALSRAGIVFTKAQRDQVAAIQKNQGVMAAQKVVLGELEKRFGGAAAAAGKTLPGQLQILRERFKDLSGQILSVFVPGATKAVTVLTTLVKRLSAARTTRARLDIVFTGIERIAHSIAEQLRDALARTNWQAVFSAVGALWRRALIAEGQGLAHVDWGRVGREIGERLAQALRGIAAFLRTVDWSKVGGAIVSGIITFLRGINWTALFKGVVTLWVAALKASAALLLGAGKALAGAILEGLKAGARLALLFVEKWALQLVEKVTGAFGFLGKFDPLKGVNAKVRRQIADIQREIDKMHGKDVTINVIAKAVGTGGGVVNPEAPNQPKAQGPKRGTQTTRQVQQAATQQAATAAAVSSGAKKTETAAKSAASALEKARTAFGKLMDSLSLGMERAQATARLSDDIAQQRKINAAIEAEIKVEGRTTELARQLFEGRQNLAALQSQQRQSNQFKALGLTGTGEKRAPSIAALTKRLGSLKEMIKGTPLDTAKTQTELARIAKVLAGKFGKVGRDVRLAILGMFDDISSGLKDGAKQTQEPLTKTSGLNTKKFIQGLGLSPEQIRELRGRLSGLNSGGLALAGATAGGIPTVRDRGFGPIVVESRTMINLDGKKVADVVTRQQQRSERRNPKQKRGPNRHR